MVFLGWAPSGLTLWKVDWLVDEGQCHIGVEETGSGNGTLLLFDRANLFEFGKRHHFLKILH